MYHDIDNVEFVGRWNICNTTHEIYLLWSMVVNWKWLWNNIERPRNSRQWKGSGWKRVHFSLRVRVVYSDKIFVKDDAVKFQCGERNFEVISFFLFFSQIFWNFLDIWFFRQNNIRLLYYFFLLFKKYIYIYNICVQIMIFEEQDKVNFISLIVSITILFIISSKVLWQENLISSSLLVHRNKSREKIPLIFNKQI